MYNPFHKSAIRKLGLVKIYFEFNSLQIPYILKISTQTLALMSSR